jgi:hypothetical protein
VLLNSRTLSEPIGAESISFAKRLSKRGGAQASSLWGSRASRLRA